MDIFFGDASFLEGGKDVDLIVWQFLLYRYLLLFFMHLIKIGNQITGI